MPRIQLHFSRFWVCPKVRKPYHVEEFDCFPDCEAEDHVEVAVEGRIQHLVQVLIELKAPIPEFVDGFGDALEELFLFGSVQVVVVLSAAVGKLEFVEVEDLEEAELLDHEDLGGVVHALVDEGVEAEHSVDPELLVVGLEELLEGGDELAEELEGVPVDELRNAEERVVHQFFRDLVEILHDLGQDEHYVVDA